MSEQRHVVRQLLTVLDQGRRLELDPVKALERLRALARGVENLVQDDAPVALILRHFGVEPEQDFGVAPSTLRYWKETGRCAPLAG